MFYFLNLYSYREYSRKKTIVFNSFNSLNSFNSYKLLSVLFLHIIWLSNSILM